MRGGSNMAGAARVRWLLPVVALVFALSALAQQPSPETLEAEARAQRIADRIKLVILNAGKAAAPRRNEPATPAIAKPAPPRPPAPVAETAARRLPVTPKSVAPAAETPVPAPAVEPTLAEASAAPASAVLVLQPVTIQGQRRVTLFDFEESTSGFALHAYSNWALLPAHQIGLTTQAQGGQQALEVRASERAWLGVDLDDAVDFTDLGTISYWLQTQQTPAPTFAIKSGTQYDWCKLSVTVIDRLVTPAGTFVHYEADVRSAPKVCRHVDLTDVRGIFWDIQANADLTLDTVSLH